MLLIIGWDSSEGGRLVCWNRFDVWELIVLDCNLNVCMYFKIFFWD